ncbi:hypothetical protein ABEB36_013466 [Hypothenemus hampei]|uniref:Shootin-1 n=1 Tax=Hypothenemus hampei TaxID=57062 RepID=A0ABD1ECI0_HYPHA
MHHQNNRSITVANRYTSNIPLRTVSRQNSSSGTIPAKSVANGGESVHKWKHKYLESEEKRKSLLTEKEKVLRNLNDLERKHVNLQVKHEHLETELFEKNEEFTKLSIASKNLYKEYETLKNQYETETTALSRAMKDASQWYKENKQLKRKTLLLMTDKDTVDEGVEDSSESTNDADDIENLNKTIKQLSTEVAELQTELDAARQNESQTMEQNAKLSDELDFLKVENAHLKLDLNGLRNEHQQLLRVTEIMKHDLNELREIRELQRNDIIELRKEAGEQKKERNILAHQSNLLLQGLTDDENGTDAIKLLQEIEILKRTIEEERTRYEDELSSLQERLDEQETNSHVEILEERLKLVETELEKANSRAEAAERNLKISLLAPPPPPPPLPPPLPSFIIGTVDAPPIVPLRRRKSEKAIMEDLAKTIGVEKSTQNAEKKPFVPAPGVNEDIINAIKEGKFTLRKRKKESLSGDGSKVDKETPKAVSEILNILGSLRRAPKKRLSQSVVADINP